ncbi:MAG: DNA gyrase inhibitor YacG [Planctomycetes bacterium]|nr:DNA gyrase inhibitor YacG [Planctomycetota bacterium]
MVRQPTCPICRSQLPATTATESKFFPFCGERCRDVDYLRWSDGRYAIVEPLDPAQMAADMIEKEEAEQDSQQQEGF